MRLVTNKIGVIKEILYFLGDSLIIIHCATNGCVVTIFRFHILLASQMALHIASLNNK